MMKVAMIITAQFTEPTDCDRNGTANAAYSFGGNAHMDMGQVLFPNKAFTTALWVRPTHPSQWQHLIENGTVANSYGGAFRLQLGNTGKGFIAVGDGSSISETEVNFAWESGEWFHLTMTFDGNQVVLYKNGQAIDTLSTNLDIRNGDGKLLIGSFEGTGRFFKGSIDEVRIYDRKLSANEADQLWKFQPPPPPTPPNITSQPVADQNATIGSNVTFSVDANGTELNYQWQKRDANGTWVNIDGATASNYVINSVQAINAGTYRVAITNTKGGLTTHSANSVLHVNVPDSITHGLIAYYPFDGSANDGSGHDHNGTVHGATLTADRNGTANAAYSFGGNAHMDMGQVLFPNKAFTTALWVKSTTPEQWQHLIENGTTANVFNGAFRLQLGNPGKGFIAVGDGNALSETEVDFAWESGEWFHLAMTYDGSQVVLYKNGQAVGTLSSNLDIRNGDGKMLIGCHQSVSGPMKFFKGSMDEVRIYDRALNANEANLLFNHQPTTPAITSQPVADQNATAGGNVTLSVNTNGSGLTYQWQKQDSNGTYVNIPGATASSYTINSVHPIHAGIYRVVITNALGGIIHSANSNLHVTAPTGGKLWEFETEGHVRSSPAITANGTV